ncbi:MAG: metal-sensitive transcriptional regulator [Dehalococcoidia bacterium]
MEPGQIRTRLRRIEGQVRGVQRMLEDERDCEEILGQCLAVRAAVEQVCLMLTEHHVRECVLAGQFAPDDPRLQEISDALKLLVRSGA